MAINAKRDDDCLNLKSFYILPKNKSKIIKMAKKSKLMKVIDWVLNILIIVFLIGTIYMILWKIFGDSPTDFQVISWAVGLFGAAVFKLFSFTYNMNREVGELKTGVRNGFGSVKEDIGSLKEDIHEIKNLVKKK